MANALQVALAAKRQQDDIALLAGVKVNFSTNAAVLNTLVETMQDEVKTLMVLDDTKKNREAVTARHKGARTFASGRFTGQKAFAKAHDKIVGTDKSVTWVYNPAKAEAVIAEYEYKKQVLAVLESVAAQAASKLK